MQKSRAQFPIQPDEWKINMNDAWQVLWWCRYLGLTKSQLEMAINAVGPVIIDLKQYLAVQKIRSGNLNAPQIGGNQPGNSPESMPSYTSPPMAA